MGVYINYCYQQLITQYWPLSFHNISFRILTTVLSFQHFCGQYTHCQVCAFRISPPLPHFTHHSQLISAFSIPRFPSHILRFTNTQHASVKILRYISHPLRRNLLTPVTTRNAEIMHTTSMFGCWKYVPTINFQTGTMTNRLSIGNW